MYVRAATHKYTSRQQEPQRRGPTCMSEQQHTSTQAHNRLPSTHVPHVCQSSNTKVHKHTTGCLLHTSNSTDESKTQHHSNKAHTNTTIPLYQPQPPQPQPTPTPTPRHTNTTTTNKFVLRMDEFFKPDASPASTPPPPQPDQSNDFFAAGTFALLLPTFVRYILFQFNFLFSRHR